ncbi:MAG TPA: hypothetical protein VLC46_11605 [Thermoanaerobaculia bacterium]|jgi:hypothetical protein|nr:hypothetical protein [Thermoanaerobaculia bacterium]
MKNPVKMLTIERLENDVNVIGHHAPGKEFVPAAVKVLQIVGDSVCELWIPKMALAALDMQLVVETLSESYFDTAPLDHGELPEAMGELILHRFPFLPELSENVDR